MYVAPKSVSGRVVKTVIRWPPGVANTSSAPSDRPIQFVWRRRVEADQSSVSRLARSRSAYCVIRKNHCSSTRCSTFTSGWRSQKPLMTCSLASTVLQAGHQFTAPRLR
jgi:hypothetical protein